MLFKKFVSLTRRKGMLQAKHKTKVSIPSFQQ